MTTDEIMALADEYSDAHLQMVTQGGLDPLVFRDSLQSAIEALQADAARYRWLRGRNDSQEVDPPGPYVVQDDRYGNVQFLGATEADEAIDAAMGIDKP